MEGAVHRLEVIFLPVQFHGGVHVLFVEVQVAAGLPQAGPPDVGRVDDAVAVTVVNVPPEVLDDRPQDAALGVPHHQPGANLLVGAEQAQLPSQDPVVATLGLFQPRQVVVQFLLALEGGAVDALEHGTVLVAAPVGPGHVQQLQGRYRVGAVDVGALAQVNEVAVAVDAQGLIFGDGVDNLQLVGLVGEHFLGLGAAQLLPLEWVSLGDSFAHQLFDLGNVFWSEGTGHVKIVVETVLGGRADPHFGFGEQLQHRVGHDVGCRVAQAVPQRLNFVNVLRVGSAVI